MGTWTIRIFANLFVIVSRVKPVLRPRVFSRESDIYNLANAKKIAREHGITLVRTFADYLSVSKDGFKQNLVVITCDMSDEHVKILSEALGDAGRLILVVPKGQKRDRKFWQQVHKLMDRVFVRVITLEEDVSIDSPDKTGGMIMPDWQFQPVP